MVRRLLSVALVASTLGSGCSLWVGDRGGYLPDTEDNRLNSGWETLGCDEHPGPQVVDMITGTILLFTAATAAAHGLDWFHTGFYLLMPAGLAYGSALYGHFARERCRSQTRTYEAERAVVAARAGDCATVKSIDPQIMKLDPAFYRDVFVRDPAIKVCLDRNDRRFFCATSPTLTELCFCSPVEAQCVERQRSIAAMGATMNECTASPRDVCQAVASPPSPAPDHPGT